jgi:hypothetical protein
MYAGEAVVWLGWALFYRRPAVWTGLAIQRAAFAGSCGGRSSNSWSASAPATGPSWRTCRAPEPPTRPWAYTSRSPPVSTSAVLFWRVLRPMPAQSIAVITVPASRIPAERARPSPSSRSPEPKIAKDRVHLDVQAGGGRSQPWEVRWPLVTEVVQRLAAAGATVVREDLQDGTPDHVVMADRRATSSACSDRAGDRRKRQRAEGLSSVNCLPRGPVRPGWVPPAAWRGTP